MCRDFHCIQIPTHHTLSLASALKGLRQAVDPLSQEKLDLNAGKVDLKLGAEQARWIWVDRDSE